MSYRYACLLVVALIAQPVSAQSGSFLNRSRADWLKDLENQSSPTMRRSAAFALGNIADKRDLDILLTVTHKEGEDASVRAAAATACGDMVLALARKRRQNDGDPALWVKVSTVMKRLLDQDKDPRVRRAAVYTLGTFGPTAAPEIPLLLTHLRKDDNATVRQNAAWALGRLQDSATPEVLNQLIDVVQNDAEALVRRDAATALGDLLALRSRDAAPLDKATRDDAVRALFALARAESDRGEKGDPVVQKTAMVKLYSVVGLDDKKVADRIAGLINHEDPETARLAAFILARTTNDAARNPAVVRTIARSLNDPEERFQEAAVVCLSALGADAAPAVPELTACLDADRSATMKQSVAVALEHIGLPAHPAVPALARLVASPLTENDGLRARMNAAIAISMINYAAMVKNDRETAEKVQRDAVMPLLKVIENTKENPAIRSCAASLFLNVRDLEVGGAEGILVKVLDETDPETKHTRYNAARALAFVRQDKAPPKAAAVLVQMMKDDSLRKLVGTTATGNGNLGETGRTGTSQTQEVLGDDARYMAAEALRVMAKVWKDDPAVVAALRKAAGDPSKTLQEAAAKALQAAGQE